MILFKRKIKDQKGAALILSVLLFLLISSTMVFGAVSPVVRYLGISKDFVKSKQSYYAAEAGSEDAFYRINNNIAITLPLTLTIDGATATTTLTVTGSNEKNILTEGNKDSVIRKVSKDLNTADGFSFNYGVQVGLGGLSMYGNSDVLGNVYSNGYVYGNSNSSNTIWGSVVAAGPSGRIDNIYATSSAYAHSLTNMRILGNAYYKTIDSYSSSHISGTKYASSTDQGYVDMPISDDLITSWENAAALGGIITTPCTYRITTSVSIGPKKINCDLEISGNNTIVTLTGTLWVSGNVTIYNKPSIKVANAIGDKSVAIIAHKISNTTSSSMIDIQDKAQFFASTNAQGAANPNSYVMLISQNNDSEVKGGYYDNTAIDVQNGVVGNLLIYAPHGEIYVENHAVLREVTGYQVTLLNNSLINYQIGLAQPLFTDGPSGRWKIKRWREHR